METARMKQDKETDEDGNKRSFSMERSKEGTKKRSPDGLTYPNQNTIIMNITLQYFIRHGKRTMKFN